jgi:hypothetical protein
LKQNKKVEAKQNSGSKTKSGSEKKGSFSLLKQGKWKQNGSRVLSFQSKKKCEAKTGTP